MAPSIEARLAKLEKLDQRPTRMFTISVGRHSDDEVRNMLEANGHDVQPSDMLVFLRTFYEERDGSLAADKHPPRLLCVANLSARGNG